MNRFINLPPHPNSGFQSIPDFVKMEFEGGSSELKSPFEVSDMLHEHADRALETLASMDAGDQRELAFTLHDIRTMALLGKYYAHKIAGSTFVALYRESQERAIPGRGSCRAYCSPGILEAIYCQLSRAVLQPALDQPGRLRGLGEFKPVGSG